MRDLPDLAVLALQMTLAVLAAAAAIHKLADPSRSRRAAHALLGLSGPLADLGWSSALLLEAFGAGLVLVGGHAREGLILLAVVWSGYAVTLARLVWLRRSEDCGCGFGRASPGHGFGLVRALLLVGLALAGASASSMTASLVMLLCAAPAAFVLFLIYLAAEEIGSRSRQAWSRP